MNVQDPLVPVMRPVMPPSESIAVYLDEMSASGWFSNFGPLSRRLEQRVADHVGSEPDRVVAVANATLGLVGAMRTSDASSWVLPSWTFTATAAAAMQTGGPASFADVTIDDWWMRDRGAPDQGVLRVAPFGADVRPPSWDAAGDVVIDAAASLGAAEGSLAELPPHAAVVFSFHATKVMGAGEGGVVVLGDPDRAARLRAWSNFGFAGSRVSADAGVNAKLSEPAAACALAALDGWPKERDEWRAARELTDRVLTDVGLCGAPDQEGRISPYWIAVFPDRCARDHAARVLADRGVTTRCWWGEGCHRMPAYRHLPRTSMPVTEHLADTVLGLPMFRGLSRRDTDLVERALDDARELARRAGASSQGTSR